MLIPKKESEKVEFKPKLNNEVIETLAAFSNTKGGTVYVGVSDKTKEVIGITLGKESIPEFINEVKHKITPTITPAIRDIDIDGKTVVLVSVDVSPVRPVAFFGKYYKRINASNHLMSAEDIGNMSLQTTNASWDMYPDPDHTLDDLSFDKVRKSMDTLRERGITVGKSVKEFLSKSYLLRDGRPTFAAFLLFKSEDFVTTTIELGRFQTPTLIKDSARTKADILTQVDEVVNYVKKHINMEVIITGNPRNTQKWQYPMEAIREIVLNMIIHRDYRSASDSIVKIFNDKIEFYNPGRLPDAITVEDLLSDNYRSIPRNKKIAEFFKDLGLIEKYGSGITRIIGYFKEADLPIPKFRNIAEGFMVTVFSAEATERVGVNNGVNDGVNNGVNNGVNDGVNDGVMVTVKDTIKVTENQRHIMYELSKAPYISAEKLSEIIGITPRNVEENIAKLKVNGLVERIGSDKSGYWRVLTDDGNKRDGETENVKIKDCHVPDNVPNDVPNDVPEKRLVVIVDLMKNDAKISLPKLAEMLNVNHKTIKRDIQKLKSEGIIERIGSNNGGYWKVIPNVRNKRDLKRGPTTGKTK